MGCGYGRDSRYLAAELGCRVLGLDPSPAAVAAARKARRPGLTWSTWSATRRRSPTRPRTPAASTSSSPATSITCSVRSVAGSSRRLSPPLVRPGGLLFLSTLSPRDPQHYAVGEPVLGEERSWVDHVYLHFCTADELAADFSAFTVLDLEERSYDEQNANGVVHRHASWFLEGRRR